MVERADPARKMPNLGRSYAHGYIKTPRSLGTNGAGKSVSPRR
jgi:hypothetical protein